MKSYHKERGWLVQCVGHPKLKPFFVRLPYEPHDGPRDAIEMLPAHWSERGTPRQRWRLRAATKKDGDPKTTTYKGETFAVVEYAYEED